MWHHNIIINEPVVADGKLHRFHAQGDKPGTKDGFYVLYCTNGVYSGMFGSWRINGGEQINWCSKRKEDFSPEEHKTFIENINRSKMLFDEERKQRLNDAKESAKHIWNESKFANDNHPYLIKKRIKAVGLRCDADNKLIAPLYGIDKQLHSLQFISIDGEKRFLPGGAVTGNYFPIGKIKSPKDRLYIGEGVATCLTIHQLSGCAVACAFNCGNLLSVAQTMRTKFPEAQIFLVADNDLYTPNNPGLTKARGAANAVNAKLIYPDFTNVDTSSKPTDFNDLMCISGIDEVKKQLECFDIPHDDSESTKPGISFQEYKPFNDDLLPVESVPYDALPEKMSEYIKEHSEIRGCPPDYILVSLLARIGCVFAGKIKIALTKNTDWCAIPNFYWMMIGDPSSGKSNAFGLTSKPIQMLEAQARKEYQEAFKTYKDKCNLLDRKLKAAYKGLERESAKKSSDEKEIKRFEALIQSYNQEIHETEKERPKLKRHTIQKLTIEKLILILEENPEGLMLEIDELTSMFIRLSKDENCEERCLYLTGYNGNQPFSYSTVKRGDVLISNLILSILGGAQPSKIKRFINEARNGTQDDGFLQRFQGVVYPDKCLMRPVDKNSDDDLSNNIAQLFQNLATLSSNVTTLQFNEKAQETFDKWRNTAIEEAHELGKVEASNPVSTHIGKSYEFVAALAGYLYLSENNGFLTADKLIGKEYVLSAINLGSYFLSHAKRMYRLGYKDNMPARSLSDKLLTLVSPDKMSKHHDNEAEYYFFTRSQIRTNNWSDLNTKEQRLEAINVLINRGHISKEAKGRYYINPEHLKE